MNQNKPSVFDIKEPVIFPKFNNTQHFFNFRKQKTSLASFTRTPLNYATIQMENEMPASEPLSNLNLTLVPSFSYYRRNYAIYAQAPEASINLLWSRLQETLL